MNEEVEYSGLIHIVCKAAISRVMSHDKPLTSDQDLLHTYHNRRLRHPKVESEHIRSVAAFPPPLSFA